MTENAAKSPLAAGDFKQPPAPRSRAWLIFGLALWTFVFIAAVVLFRLRARLHDQARQPADSSRLDALLVPASTNGDAATVKAENEPAGREPAGHEPAGRSKAEQIAESPWSPAGVQDFVFTERNGRKVTKADLLGHPWLICFIFTRCAGPCPAVSAQMSQLQKLLEGSDVRLVTLTVDPDFDTPDVLNRYAKAFRADPTRWLYLRGDKRKTYELINQSFLMPVQETTGADRQPGYEVLHSTNIMLVNEKGVVVQKFNAQNEVDMARLRHDLRPYLKKEVARAAEADARKPAGKMGDVEKVTNPANTSKSAAGKAEKH